MVDIKLTSEFADWLASLRGDVERARISARLVRVRRGNFGDHKPVGSGVWELRFAFGPGYRVYYTMRGGTLVVLLCGGHKGTQRRDIERAKALAEEY